MAKAYIKSALGLRPYYTAEHYLIVPEDGMQWSYGPYSARLTGPEV